MDRSFEDAMLDRIETENQRRRVFRAMRHMSLLQQLSICLLWQGWQPHEIAAVGGRHPTGIQYHVEAVRRVVRR